MIRHIVMWKLKAEDAEGKKEAIAEIASVLEPLANVIDGVRSLRVHANSEYADVNWDAVLVGDYDTIASLDEYQVHPEHQAAAAIVRSHAAQRAAVDFEV
ncbi:Dabb family protein [soil metagenome]